MKNFIYILQHPTTFEIKYVGKTNNLKQRYYQHTSEKCLINTGSKKLAAWILKLLRSNMKPIMSIIEECESDWQPREVYWIQYYKDKGYDLCNLSTGGDGVGHTELSKSKISSSLKGRVRTKEERDKISKSMAGRKRPNSGKAISEAHKKRYESIEERAKQGAKLRKSITQLSINGIIVARFISMREASRLLKLDTGCISRACKNNKPYKGFYYTYEEAENACIDKLISICKQQDK
jgi:group I intron endonuclease